MRVLYGANGTYSDVTSRVSGERFVIPEGDERREKVFGLDPLYGVLKHVIVEDDQGNKTTLPADSNGILIRSEDGVYRLYTGTDVWAIVRQEVMAMTDPAAKLAAMHNVLRLQGGSFREEFPEQLMAAKYVRPDARVLEIGGNIGRNSCIIGALLDDSRNLVVIESDPRTAEQLCANRDLNKLSFHVVPAALSKRRLVQRAWNTKPLENGEAVPAGWQEVPTQTWDEVRTAFGKEFDTLVADCEGALYYILQDEPELLRTITTVVIENDFPSLEQKEYVDARFREHGLCVVHQAPGPWGASANRFYEVWQR